MKSLLIYMHLLLGASLSKVALSFAPSSSVRRIVASTRTSTAMTMSITADNNNERKTLSIAILGGGISGLSCASQLLSQHKQSYDPSSSYDLEVTLFDTGRLRPGGRCSSRIPGDKPVVKKQSPGNNNNNRNKNQRPCDNKDKEDGTSSSNGNDQAGHPAVPVVPANIQKALDGAYLNDKSSMDRIVTGMGPVDHAAQILSIPTIKNSSFDAFQGQLQQWLEEGVVESFPEGSVCELFNTNDDDNDKAPSSTKLQPLKGEMYYGKGGMGTIPIAIRDYCLSFNGSGDNYSGQSFRMAQDVWVSPSNGVKYIGTKDDGHVVDDEKLWEIRAGKKTLGKYHHLVISHNGKCADRIMSKTPAKAFHSLLRTKFAPYVPPWGGKEMTLNSIYSLVFAVKSKTDGSGGGDGMSRLSSPIATALSELSSSSNNNKEENVYTVMIKNEPSLRLLSSNTLKHHHQQNQNSNSNIEVYTLLSSPKFGKQFKGPQENLPSDLTQKVTMKMLGNLEKALNLKEGSVLSSVVDLNLQLWGAAVPMNTWQSSTVTSPDKSSSGRDGFVYDATFGVGACGDWILDPSIAGAWESGRRLANWMLTSQEGKSNNDGSGSKSMMSVGLPDRSPKEESGKFVPSRVALESGIGTIPASPNSDRPRGSPSKPESSRQSNKPNSNGNGSRNNNGRRRNINDKGGRPNKQPVS